MTHATIPICWDPNRAGKAISLKAKVDEKQIDYFLACHSPITHIRNAKKNSDLGEEELFESLFLRSKSRDLQAVIYGEPGTGKSHLVHWLKLRSDDALRRGELAHCVSILIERGSGSLKHALEQLITQLVSKCGTAFEEYLQPVQQAFDRISDATARQKLVVEMATELGPRWADRGRPELPKLLRSLAEACRSEGFGTEWLCRDNGVIARRIALLTHSSSVEDRESRPEFEDAELQVPLRFLSPRKNSDQVIELAQELADDPSLRAQALNYLNIAIDSAMVELTGLSGANLRKVFDRIRNQLEQQKRRLLVFVEDVSAMAELDMEVINALEPQDRLDLCPMIAVLGMTDEGYRRLRDNQRARFQFQVQVGDQAAHQWADDSQKVAEFAARYLNALRLADDDVRRLSLMRREAGGDVPISACSRCPVKEECHEAFGKVSLHGIDIGMYPFSVVAPQKLLARLDVSKTTGLAKNQRGFLMHVLSPIIEDPSTLQRGAFPPTQQLSLRLPGDPVYWTEFQQRYCGGWPEDEKRRLRDLAQLWIADTATAADAADRLAPFLGPLGFRQLSKQGREAPGSKKQSPEPKPAATPSPLKRQSKSTDRLRELLEELTNWFERGDRLRSAAFWRKCVADLLRKSIPWEDLQDLVPLPEVERLIGTGYEFVYIDDQGVEPKTSIISLRLFPRILETRNLLEALARYEEQGGRTWSFEGAELHKRRVSRWLRRSTDQIIKQLQPGAPCDPIQPIRSATQFLCLAAIVRRRSRLPQINADLLQELFSPFNRSPSEALSTKWKKLVDDIAQRWEEVRDCILQEISVLQSRIGSANFIAPEVVQATAQAFRKNVRIDPLSEDYGKSFWKSRYRALLGWKEYEGLTDALNDERAAATAILRDITKYLDSLNIDGNDFEERWLTFSQEIIALVETTAATKVFVHAPEFQSVVKSGVFKTKSSEWARFLKQSQQIVDEAELIDVLTLDTQPLRDIQLTVEVTVRYLLSLESELQDQEHEFSEEGDPLQLHAALLKSLETLSGLTAVTTEDNDVETD